MRSDVCQSECLKKRVASASSSSKHRRSLVLAVFVPLCVSPWTGQYHSLGSLLWLRLSFFGFCDDRTAGSSSVALYQKVDYFVNSFTESPQRPLLDGRRGFSVTAVVTDWLTGSSSGGQQQSGSEGDQKHSLFNSPGSQSFKRGTVALVVGTNNYFFGRLAKNVVREMVKRGRDTDTANALQNPTRHEVFQMANVYIQKTVDEIRAALLSQQFKNFLRHVNPSKTAPTEQDLPWYWLSPLGLCPSYSQDTRLPSSANKAFFNSLVKNQDVHELGEVLGLTQRLLPHALDADELSDFQKQSRILFKTMKQLAKQEGMQISQKDVCPTSQLAGYGNAAYLPSFSFHHLYGGWYDLRGVLVIGSLQEPKSVTRPVPLSASNFLDTPSVQSKLRDALNEYISRIQGEYLAEPLNEGRPKPTPLMRWKDITQAERGRVLHYNVHHPTALATLGEDETPPSEFSPHLVFRFPAPVPVPASAYLLECDPVLYWRLTQFGNGSDFVLELPVNLDNRILSLLSDNDGNSLSATWAVSVTALLLLLCSLAIAVALLCVACLRRKATKKRQTRMVVVGNSIQTGRSPSAFYAATQPSKGVWLQEGLWLANTCPDSIHLTDSSDPYPTIKVSQPADNDPPFTKGELSDGLPELQIQHASRTPPNWDIQPSDFCYAGIIGKSSESTPSTATTP